MTAAQALAQALVAHQPRYYGTPGYWATAVGEMAPGIIASLRAAGWVLVPLVDFPSQSCDACGLEHPGSDCQQPDLFEESA